MNRENLIKQTKKGIKEMEDFLSKRGYEFENCDPEGDDQNAMWECGYISAMRDIQDKLTKQ